LIDPSAADHAVAVVEHDGLSRRDRELWRVEDDLSARVAERPHGRGRGLMAMPNLHRRANRRARLLRDPVHA